WGVMAGSGPKPLARAARRAAPVGVVSSIGTSIPCTGALAPASNATTAGAGLGRMPWALRAVPVPTATGAERTSSTPRSSSPEHGVTIGAGVEQRSERHVAGDAGERVEPGDGGHARRARWSQARATAQAAPKPLSIPTTVTPAAHEASMASSAVTPPKLAP